MHAASSQQKVLEFASAHRPSHEETAQNLVGSRHLNHLRDALDAGLAGVESPIAATLHMHQPVLNETFRTFLRREHPKAHPPWQNCTSFGDLEGALSNYLVRHNAKPKPFFWSKSTKDIFIHESRELDALDQIRGKPVQMSHPEY